MIIDDFLSQEECKFILDDLQFALWRPSMTYMLQKDGKRKDVMSPLRVSETAQQRFFSEELQEKMVEIESRLQQLIKLEVNNLENWQATDYPNGGTFFYHMDSGYWESHYAGDRIYTFLLYLTTPEKGGGTHFRALDRKVNAKAGRLIIWNNLFANGDSNHRMIHSSMPLLKGKKTTLVTWLRQKKFRLEEL
ncbi:MAG: 2OG-Fe(II) oxygenase [Arenimonas sp.]